MIWVPFPETGSEGGIYEPMKNYIYDKTLIDDCAAVYKELHASDRRLQSRRCACEKYAKAFATANTRIHRNRDCEVFARQLNERCCQFFRFYGMVHLAEPEDWEHSFIEVIEEILRANVDSDMPDNSNVGLATLLLLGDEKMKKTFRERYVQEMKGSEHVVEHLLQFRKLPKINSGDRKTRWLIDLHIKNDSEMATAFDKEFGSWLEKDMLDCGPTLVQKSIALTLAFSDFSNEPECRENCFNDLVMPAAIDRFMYAILVVDGSKEMEIAEPAAQVESSVFGLHFIDLVVNNSASVLAEKKGNELLGRLVENVCKEVGEFAQKFLRSYSGMLDEAIVGEISKKISPTSTRISAPIAELEVWNKKEHRTPLPDADKNNVEKLIGEAMEAVLEGY